jgi:hypothetical protein
VLFDQASRQHNYQLFVLHDSDPDGYNIARTLREETARMPDYAVDVIDLGLRWDDAMALGLETETFPRKRALPEGLVLTEAERRAFEGQQQYQGYGKPPVWICERVELNAFSAPGLVAYIEDRLAATGVRGKIIPPDTHLTETATKFYRQELGDQIQAYVDDLLRMDQLTNRVRQPLLDAADWSEARTWIEETFSMHPTYWWERALRSSVHDRVEEQRDDLRTAVQRALLEQIQASGLTEQPSAQ